MAQDSLLGFPAHILPYRFLDSLRQGKHLPFWPVLTSFWKGALLVEKRIDRVIFTCGGTAGHVNPAIAVAQLMAEKNPQIKILFVGAERGLEKDLIPKAGYEFRTVHISSFHRSFKPAEIRHILVSLVNMVRSPAEARAILKEFRPDAVIGTGGYASYPTVKAAAKMGIPTAVHESNAVPGLTTELLEPYAGRIMVGFESCRQHYKHPEKVAVTGTPVREDFFTLTKEAAKEKLGVNDGRPLIVSFWGSLGASGMNAQMADMLALEAGKEPFHHIHGAGKSGYAAVLKALAEKGVDLKDHPSLQVREYIYDMAPMMRALKAIHSVGAPDSMNPEDLAKQRAGQELLGRLAAPMIVMKKWEPFSLKGMAAAWVKPDWPHDRRRVILYCHGGGYTSGNLGYSRPLASKLTNATGW